MNLKRKFAQYWERIQGSLFPWLEEELPPLTKLQQKLTAILEVLQVEDFVPSTLRGCRGRPAKCRRAILQSFVAKAVYNLPTTRMLLDRLDSDISLRRICGWEVRREIPSQSVFSRSFDDIAKTDLLHRVHENLVTSASVNDSQVAIPLAKITKQRVDNFYDVMDGGYACDDVVAHSRSLGHVPIIDWPAKGHPENKEIKKAECLACETIDLYSSEKKRFEIRTSVERVFSRLKDEFGARCETPVRNPCFALQTLSRIN